VLNECLGLYNKPKAEVHQGHKLTGGGGGGEGGGGEGEEEEFVYVNFSVTIQNMCCKAGKPHTNSILV